MKAILIATDGSAPSTEALEFGLDLAAEENATAIVVHVVHAIDSVPVGGFGVTPGAFVHDVTDKEKSVLTEATRLAKARGVEVETQLLRGTTVEQITAYADARKVDLIVVGSRGHGALTTALLGSVSRGVLSHTSRPVLIVPQSASALALDTAAEEIRHRVA
jgi:nucleotide-binding universal stress UspA family protein